MGFRINTNIAALNAQRHLSNISSKLDKSLERLSSGLRINKAADDASGMATSVYLRGQIRGLNQATRNANDAISMTQTAEGALDVSTNILLRLRELAVQSATDTTNRDLLVNEANQLITELTRVATDTEFIGNTLLNGSFQSGQIQIGANQGQTISFSIGDVRAAALGELATTTVNIDDDTTLGTVAEGGFTSGEFTINSINIAATQSSDDQVSVLDLVGTSVVRNYTMANTGAQVSDTEMSIAANVLFVTNGFSVTSLGKITSTSKATSIAQAISNAGLTGVGASAAGADSLVTLTITSGYDFGLMLSNYNTSAASVIALTGISLVGSGEFLVEMNDGGAAKISGLTINGETIATTNTNQGAGVASNLTISGSRLAGTISNSDAAFIAALASNINAVTVDTDVTARAGSGGTIVLTADEGENVVFGGMIDVMTQASFYNTVGLASGFYAQAASTVTYNGETSAMAKVAAIDSVKSNTDVDAILPSNSKTGTTIAGGAIGDGELYINGINIGAVTVAVNDGTSTLTAAINAKTSATGVVATKSNDNYLVLTAADGRNISILNESTVATMTGMANGIYRGNITLSSAKDFVITGSTVDCGGAGTATTYTTSLDNPVSKLDLSTQAGADSALAILDAAIYQVNEVRSGLGAIQARITLTIVNLTTTAENLSASDSRIKDVDFAGETAVFTKNSILTQAATAILAQANQLPQLALQLLG